MSMREKWLKDIFNILVFDLSDEIRLKARDEIRFYLRPQNYRYLKRIKRIRRWAKKYGHSEIEYWANRLIEEILEGLDHLIKKKEKEDKNGLQS